ncbi:MAG: sterol-binding domain protein [Thermoleophilia bacterium]|nr:sterol-binding domain protein [Thermoleophilia bacterium]
MASVQEYFEGLAARVPADRIEGMTNTYVFVAIADGAIVVTEGIGDADCTFSASEESFAKIVAGEQNPTTAYMTGKLKIKGDMGAAMKLQKIF